MAGRFRVGEWEVEPDLNLLRSGERSIHLEPKVMDLLCASRSDRYPEARLCSAIDPARPLRTMGVQ